MKGQDEYSDLYSLSMLVRDIHLALVYGLYVPNNFKLTTV